jgi:catechol 2,3-dioxygenase-like lactoylglutathione lyase family enzyme
MAGVSYENRLPGGSRDAVGPPGVRDLADRGRPDAASLLYDAEVRDLQRRGVTFEEYENPKTVDGIATIPVGRTAWFRDPDGNLIGMIQFNGG